MRAIIALLHRWAGLTIAGFLFITGVTGAIISWNHELDKWLNPHLSRVNEVGVPMSPIELARAVEKRHPDVRVVTIPLTSAEGEAISFYVSPRVDPNTGQLFSTGFNQVFVNPITGSEMGRREWGAVWPITTESLMSFLYVLHYSLHSPKLWGIEQRQLGMWILGVVGIIWMVDCFFGFYLTLPVRKARRASSSVAAHSRSTRRFLARWAVAWKIKTSGSLYRVNVDIHRAFGLWTWVALLMLAVTAVSLNLDREVAQPIVKLFSTFTPTPYDLRTARPKDNPIEPKLSWEEVVTLAEAEAHRRGWTEPAGSVSYAERYGIYRVSFLRQGDEDGGAGVGPPQLYFDGVDGRYLGDRTPWRGSAGDIFLQLQLPLHSGRIVGLPGRIFVSFLGLVVAALSITGVVIWDRKRRSRMIARHAGRLPEPGPLSSTE